MRLIELFNSKAIKLGLKTTNKAEIIDQLVIAFWCSVFAERRLPAMRVRRKKLYFYLENKPPDERAETGSPTVYEFVHREVLFV